jgi:hypothetical protein
MILDLIFGMFLGILNAVLALIPSFEIWSPTVSDSGGSFTGGNFSTMLGAWLAIWDLFAPVAAVFTVLLGIIAARVFVVAVQLLRWVWDSLPMKSS